MLKSIFDDIRFQFDSGNKITRLIIINAIAFIAINLVRLGFVISAGFEYDMRFDDIVRLFSISADLVFDATHPWVLITHMFLHIGFWHFLFNMLFLYWFGRIVGDMIGDHRINPLYLMSGWFGALVFLISAPLIGASGGYAYGASASVMGFVVASGMLAPEYNMRLLLIGDVKLKYVVLAVVLIDLFGIGGLDNVGGHLAHLGGVTYGALYITLLRRGRDLAIPLNSVFDRLSQLFSGRRKSVPGKKPSKVFVRHMSASQPRSASARPLTQKEQQEHLDEILDKIKEKGYDNLTDEEKEFLFKASKK